MSMEIGEKIMRLRQSKGLSQEELVYRLGVSRQAVSKWETGQTMPDIEKVLAMSELFGVSTDYLLKNNTENEQQQNSTENISQGTVPQKQSLREKLHYEYKSKRTIFGLPLLHINIGLGLYRAKGFFSIGMLSTGIISLGLISLGLISWGLLSLGLFSFGTFSLGAISIGAIAAGILAIGGIALGVFSIGGLAIGMYSMGGCAIASQIAFGGYAQGRIAIGDKTVGDFCWQVNSGMTNQIKEEIYLTIQRELPNTPGFILNLFT